MTVLVAVAACDATASLRSRTSSPGDAADRFDAEHRDVAGGPESGPGPVDASGCAPGTTRPCGNDWGICRAGVQTCAPDGTWADCVGAVPGAADETCGNWLDDDCDGATDEDCACMEGDRMPCERECGRGGQSCTGGRWGPCEVVPDDTVFSVIVLTGTIRDFNASHPDFQDALGAERGLVREMLDAEGKPELTPGPHRTVSSPESFRQWYRDVPGVNASMPFGIPLRPSESPGVFTFDAPDYFPIDGMLLAETHIDHAGRPRNFHFTTELRGRMQYRGGETFRFRGDDDVWVFVGGRLVMDLGGVHGPLEATVSFDDIAPTVGLERGRDYEIAFFHAERHTRQSSFRIDTTLGRVDACGPF
ncbi:MAG: fibro-slime domain-containing protein [Myxococcota bacterium]|nr:fibro-slime domain-containing protein [Myxococcota bacterium]MDW8361371.1 fibro-slime domain-containing protein [Myxococcales bacterium]